MLLKLLHHELLLVVVILRFWQPLTQVFQVLGHLDCLHELRFRSALRGTDINGGVRNSCQAHISLGYLVIVKLRDGL